MSGMVGKWSCSFFSDRFPGTVSTHMKNVTVIISVRPAGPALGRGKNFNVTIFSDTKNVINLKLSSMSLIFFFTTLS